MYFVRVLTFPALVLTPVIAAAFQDVGKAGDSKLNGLKAKRYGEDECCSQDRVTVTVTTIPPYCASSAVAGLPEASSAAPTSAAAGGQTSVAPTSAAAGESSMPASSTLAGETTAAPVSQATGPSTETARITSVLTVHTSATATSAAGGGFVPMPVPIPTYGAATTAAEGESTEGPAYTVKSEESIAAGMTAPAATFGASSPSPMGPAASTKAAGTTASGSPAKSPAGSPMSPTPTPYNSFASASATSTAESGETASVSRALPANAGDEIAPHSPRMLIALVGILAFALNA